MTHESIEPTNNLHPPETTKFCYRQLQIYVVSFFVSQYHAVQEYEHCSVRGVAIK